MREAMQLCHRRTGRGPRPAGGLEGTIERYDVWLHVEQAWLAHGDFDVTHIYQHDGRYTGIIDFGEMRGAHQLYDLGHFNLHDGEVVPQRLLPALLEGYREVLPLPPDRERRISLMSVLIGVRALARNVRRQPPNAYQRHLASAIQRSIALLNSWPMQHSRWASPAVFSTSSSCTMQYPSTIVCIKE